MTKHLSIIRNKSSQIRHSSKMHDLRGRLRKQGVYVCVCVGRGEREEVLSFLIYQLRSHSAANGS